MLARRRCVVTKSSAQQSGHAITITLIGGYGMSEYRDPADASDDPLGWTAWQVAKTVVPVLLTQFAKVLERRGRTQSQCCQCGAPSASPSRQQDTTVRRRRPRRR